MNRAYRNPGQAARPRLGCAFPGTGGGHVAYEKAAFAGGCPAVRRLCRLRTRERSAAPSIYALLAPKGPSAVRVWSALRPAPGMRVLAARGIDGP